MSTHPLTLEERVAARTEGLSPTELRVAAFMREHPEEVAFLSVTELAGRLETSDATVIRTAQALGYAGIPDLRRQLIEQLRLKITPAVRLGRSLQGLTAAADQLLEAAFDAQIEQLELARRSLDPDRFSRAVELLVSAKRVLTFGTGVAAHLSAMFAVRLQRIGCDALSISATGAGLADTLLTMREGDVLLALVNEQAPADSRFVLAEAARRNVPIVLVTDTLSGLLGEQASVTLAASRADAGTFKSLMTECVVLEILVLGVAAQDRTRSLRALDEFGQLRAHIVGHGSAGGPQLAE
jgi:DNA-binding MurR/RpiR family transcriptional regulator